MKTLIITFVDVKPIIIRDIKNMFYACGHLIIYHNDGTFERYKLNDIVNFNVL